MFERLETDARPWVLKAATQEAGRRGDRRIGSDHLLLGMFHDPKGLATRTLGADLATARAAVDALDRAALVAIGLDLAEQDFPTPNAKPNRAHQPWNSSARGVMVRAVEEARRTKSRRIETRHLLLALLERQPPDPAGQLIEALGVDVAVARANLAAAA
jgi:ATP-dependent Clp protease ATP-binding subunit ClpA